MKKNLLFTFFILSFSCLLAQEKAPVDQLKYSNYDYLKNKVKEPKFTNPYLKLSFGEMSFLGDVANETKPFNGRNSYKVGLSSQYNKQYMFSIYLGKGTMVYKSNFGPNGIDLADLNFQSTINSIGFGIEKDIIKNKNFTPTANIGFEMVKYKSKADLNSDNQYETHLGEGNVINFPIGFGLKYKLNKRFIFNFNGNYNIVNSDDIDLNNSLAGNDSYISIEASINYDLFCSSCKETKEKPVSKIFKDTNFEKHDNSDIDNDGVNNINDYCSNTASGVSVYPEGHHFSGCPTDGDNDGIADHIDQEPNTPLGAIVNNLGIQMTDELSEQIYLNYINAESKFKAKRYENKIYPSKEYLNNVKKALNTENEQDIVYSNLFERLIQKGEEIQNFEQAVNYKIQNQENEIFKIKLSERNQLSSRETNNLLSIPNLISTYDNNSILYFTGDYSNIFSVEKSKSNISNKGYNNTKIAKDNQGEIKYLSKNEIDNLKIQNINKKTDVLYRVFIGETDSIMSDSLQNDIEAYNIITIPSNSGLIKYYSTDFNDYKDAALYRNDMLTLGFSESKIQAFKNGEQIKLSEILPKNIEDVNFDYSDGKIIFKIQLGIYAEDEYDEKLDKIFSIDNFESEQIDETGTTRYTYGNYKSLEKSINIKNTLEQEGVNDISIICFLNKKQISIKKAKELLGL